MAYCMTPKLEFPLEKYQVNSFRFRQKATHKKVYWGVHLGEDVNRSAGTRIRCIGRGKVVYSALHKGTKKKGNWGNIIIIAHKNPSTKGRSASGGKTKKLFYSLYGHLGKRYVKKGQRVKLGKVIGIVGKKNTPANGWWPSHLHFGIYVGPWKGRVLPGYWKKGQKRTKISYWKKPTRFIETYG